MAILGVLLLALIGSTCVAATDRAVVPIYCNVPGNTFPVSNDCTAYIVCDADYVAHDALCVPGMYYQPTDYGEGECVIGPCTGQVCPSTGLPFDFQDAENCHYYYECYGGSLPNHLACPVPGDYFNGWGCVPNLGACVLGPSN